MGIRRVSNGKGKFVAHKKISLSLDLSFDNKEKIGDGEAVKGRAKDLRGNNGVAVKSKSFALDPRQHPRYPHPRKTKTELNKLFCLESFAIHVTIK